MHFNAVDWIQVNAILRAHIMVVCPHVSQFLETHQVALIAPLLWLLRAAVILLWLPKVVSTPPEPDPKEIPTRCHQRALQQHYRKVTRRANAPKLAASAPMDFTTGIRPLTCDLWDTTFGGMH